MKRSCSNRSDKLNKSKNNDFKRFPNDERFYLPKSQSNHTEVAVTRGSNGGILLIFLISRSLLIGVRDHPYTANLDNLNKIFASTSISNGDSYRRTSSDEDDNDLGDKNCEIFISLD